MFALFIVVHRIIYHYAGIKIISFCGVKLLGVLLQVGTRSIHAGEEAPHTQRGSLNLRF